MGEISFLFNLIKELVYLLPVLKLNISVTFVILLNQSSLHMYKLCKDVIKTMC
jgi:hypothetical protein